VNKYPLPLLFDGKKFALRYKLNALRPDFWCDNAFVYLRDGISLIDDPPIFELPDTPVLVPPVLRVHHWPEMLGLVGNTKIIAPESNGPHHECYYIIAEDEAALSHPFMATLSIQLGQPAYIKDKHELRVWTGTLWKKP